MSSSIMCKRIVMVWVMIEVEKICGNEPDGLFLSNYLFELYVHYIT